MVIFVDLNNKLFSYIILMRNRKVVIGCLFFLLIFLIYSNAEWASASSKVCKDWE